MKQTLFHRPYPSEASIEELIYELDCVQRILSENPKSVQANTRLIQEITTEELDQKVLDLLGRYLSHPSFEHSSHTKSKKSAYGIYQIDRSLRNAVILKDTTSIRMILNTGLANAHFKPQASSQSAYELMKKNDEDMLNIQGILDAPSAKHHQHAPEFIRSPALFRMHMQKIKQQKHWTTRQAQQRSIISMLVPFSGRRILDYKSIWGMSMSSAWIMAQRNCGNEVMSKTFYALIGFSELPNQIDALQEVFDAFQKITLIVQANNPQIQDCINYKNMQKLCEDPQELARIEAKVNAIHPNFFEKHKTLTYNPKQIPTTPSGDQRTPTYDDAMQPIMDLCVYGDTIQDELNQLAHIVYKACAKIDASSPLFRQQVIQAAALLHHGIIAIHPFVDGNGRTARKLASTLCSYYGFILANDATLKSHPAIWHVKGIEYQAHGNDCSAYDVAVAQDFRNMTPYKDGVTNLCTNHFVQWLNEKQLVKQQVPQQTMQQEDAGAKTSSADASKPRDTSSISNTADTQDRPKP